MNRLRLARQIAHSILAALLLAACTGNELTDGNPHGTPLPEGRYPLAFTATQSTATPQTRVEETTNGTSSTWTDGDQISVNFGSGTQTGKYILNANGSIKQTVTPLYWQSTGEATVNGWYPATDGNMDLSNQSAELKYVLKGTGTGSYQSTPTLTFTHQLAKVRVKLTKGTSQSDLDNAAVDVFGYATCIHTKGTVTGTGEKSYLAMHKTTYNGATYYEANVMPGTLEAADAFQITIGSKSTKVTLGSAVSLVAGKWHEITLTVDTPKPLYVKLSDINTDTYTFDRDGTLEGDGNIYNKSILIADGATLTIKDVKLKAATNYHAIYGEGTATLILEGTNTADGISDYAAGVATKTSITIKGTGSLTAKGGTSTPGIGGALWTSPKCGDINIEGGTIISTGSFGGNPAAGIGSHCGNITITGGNITATGAKYAAGIGSGHSHHTGSITITGGTVVAIKGSDASNSIGAGLGGSCGTITIDRDKANVTER